MKDNRIKIRISPSDYSEKPLNTKGAFWRYINEQTGRKSDNPEKLENTFRQNFPIKLKRLLISDLQSRLAEIEAIYYQNTQPFNEKYFYERLFEELVMKEGVHFEEFANKIAKLQELKHNYFKDNIEYQRLLNKISLANQIEFKIENITYASLGGDLLTAPFEAAKGIFDNNFELFEVFLNQYIPTAFLSSLSLPVDVIEEFALDVTLNFSDSFKKEFEAAGNKQEKDSSLPSTGNKPRSNWYKARWLWMISNFTLIPVVLLAIFVCYYTFEKIETVFKIRQDSYKEMRKDNELVIKSYQELIKLQQESYLKMIHESKRDSAR